MSSVAEQCTLQLQPDCKHFDQMSLQLWMGTCSSAEQSAALCKLVRSTLVTVPCMCVLEDSGAQGCSRCGLFADLLCNACIVPKHIHGASWQSRLADEAHLQMHAGKACSCSVPALTGFITLEALSGHWNLDATAVLKAAAEALSIIRQAEDQELNRDLAFCCGAAICSWPAEHMLGTWNMHRPHELCSSTSTAGPTLAPSK